MSVEIILMAIIEKRVKDWDSSFSARDMREIVLDPRKNKFLNEKIRKEVRTSKVLKMNILKELKQNIQDGFIRGEDLRNFDMISKRMVARFFNSKIEEQKKLWKNRMN